MGLIQLSNDDIAYPAANGGLTLWLALYDAAARFAGGIETQTDQEW